MQGESGKAAWRDEPVVPDSYDEVISLVDLARKARGRIVEFSWILSEDDLRCLRSAVSEWEASVVGRYRIAVRTASWQGPASRSFTDAQGVEHYEIAAYGTLVEWADVLDLDDCGGLLDETLDEESDADETLTDIAEGGLLEDGINERAEACE